MVYSRSIFCIQRLKFPIWSRMVYKVANVRKPTQLCGRLGKLFAKFHYTDTDQTGPDPTRQSPPKNLDNASVTTDLTSIPLTCTMASPGAFHMASPGVPLYDGVSRRC